METLFANIFAYRSEDISADISADINSVRVYTSVTSVRRFQLVHGHICIYMHI